MKNVKHSFAYSLLIAVALLFSTTAFAQRGQYRNNQNRGHHDSHHHSESHSSHHYNKQRSGKTYYNRGHGHHNAVVTHHYGSRSRIMPRGCQIVYYGGQPYYRNAGGHFYSYSNGYYTEVRRPIGSRVYRVPSNCSTYWQNGNRFYSANGVCYREVHVHGRPVYEVVRYY